MTIDNKKIFLIVSEDVDFQKTVKSVIQSQFDLSTVYVSPDGADALQKIENVTPHVVIMNFHLLKVSGQQVVEHILQAKETAKTSIVITNIPDQEKFLDEMVMGRIHYLFNSQDSNEILKALNQSLNFSTKNEDSEFHICYLSPKDILLKEGEVAEKVYIVKKGKLRAFSNSDKDVTFGFIEKGDFVGEMAYINGEKRNATVEALTPCELIEIPFGTFEHVLYKKPSWSKALMHTLSKRIKKSNELKTQ